MGLFAGHVNKFGLRFVFALVVCAFLLPSSAFAATMKVTSIDVGQGDSTLIQCGSKVMLVDAGTAAESDKVVAYLKDQGITTINYLVATHPDADHIGGMVNVYKNFKVSTTWYPKKTSSTTTYKNFIKYMKLEKCARVHPRTGKIYKFSSARIKIVYGGAKTLPSNDCSIILKASCDGKSALLMGDATTKTESKLIKRKYNLKATVLKVGHHGSSGSTSSSFCKKVNAKIALFSCGKNDYGHPTMTVLDRVRSYGMKVYRTDFSGNIQVVFKDGVVSTESPEWNGEVVDHGSDPDKPPLQVEDGDELIVVYATKSGTKYHAAGCKWLTDSAYQLSLADAKTKGLYPCSTCMAA